MRFSCDVFIQIIDFGKSVCYLASTFCRQRLFIQTRKQHMQSQASSEIQDKTINDFGTQWNIFDDIDTGYYGEEELFDDILKPFISREDMCGKRVAEIGSGSGRIVAMLAGAGASQVVAVEPSSALDVCVRNTEKIKDRVVYLKKRGDQIPSDLQLDYIVSIGVIHHIPTPLPTMKACLNALKPGGRMIIWIYGKEGNELYLLFAQTMRHITKRLPAPLLEAVTWVLLPFLWLYVALCSFLPLPMAKYMRRVLGKLDSRQLRANIYDQLNPAYAKYYTKEEALDLMTQSGYEDIQIVHRHGYSWTVAGTKG